MCGIVGFVNDKDNKKTIINTMMDRIVHRGPNSSGEYIDKHVALGFRRLSIIDLEGGTQPIYNEDRTKIIIFNGEIYNYQPLREELIAAGHVFQTHADTEVLLHGYEEWGTELCKRSAECLLLLFGIMKRMSYSVQETTLGSNHIIMQK